MSKFLQLQRLTDGIIGINEAVVFDNQALITDSVEYNIYTGEITFTEKGFYYIDWFVTPQFEVNTDESSFTLVSSDGSNPYDVNPKFTGRSHISRTPTSGFAIIEVDYPGKVINLTNTSKNSFVLSQMVNVKASLAVFSITDSQDSVFRI